MLKTMYNLTAYIGTTFSTSWTYKELGAGIENISEALNEVIQQFQFMSGNGFATNHVTGMAPSFTFTGRRVMDDDAQNHIFSKKYSLDTNRESSFKLTWYDGSSTPVLNTLIVACTICNVQEWSGAATDDSAISFELRFNGAPTITTGA